MNTNELQTKETEPCDCQSSPKSTRREFMLKLGMGLNVLAGAMMGIPIIGYLFSSFFKPASLSWISLGPIEHFPEGKTRLANYPNPTRQSWDGETANIPCWVRRIEGEKFQVFAINCAHLGCPVRWFEESKLFLCPCHGGAYYEDGERAAGPPPRGLYTYPVKVVNGELFIRGGILPNLSEQTA